MNVDQKGKVLSVFALLLMPYIALAHGEEILLPLYIHGVCLLCFLIVIIAVKIRMRKKVILIGIYILTAIAIAIATWNIPYRDKQAWINFLLGIVPFIVMIIGYALINRREHFTR